MNPEGLIYASFIHSGRSLHFACGKKQVVVVQNQPSSAQ
jgi:hypothetical protein